MKNPPKGGGSLRALATKEGGPMALIFLRNYQEAEIAGRFLAALSKVGLVWSQQDLLQSRR